MPSPSVRRGGEGMTSPSARRGGKGRDKVVEEDEGGGDDILGCLVSEAELREMKAEGGGGPPLSAKQVADANVVRERKPPAPKPGAAGALPPVREPGSASPDGGKMARSRAAQQHAPAARGADKLVNGGAPGLGPPGLGASPSAPALLPGQEGDAGGGRAVEPHAPPSLDDRPTGRSRSTRWRARARTGARRARASSTSRWATSRAATTRSAGRASSRTSRAHAARVARIDALEEGMRAAAADKRPRARRRVAGQGVRRDRLVLGDGGAADPRDRARARQLARAARRRRRRRPRSRPRRPRCARAFRRRRPAAGAVVEIDDDLPTVIASARRALSKALPSVGSSSSASTDRKRARYARRGTRRGRRPRSPTRRRRARRPSRSTSPRSASSTSCCATLATRATAAASSSPTSSSPGWARRRASRSPPCDFRAGKAKAPSAAAPAAAKPAVAARVGRAAAAA